MDFGWLSLIPPVLVIFLALLTRKVYLALISGILLGALILVSWNPFTAIIMGLKILIKTLSSPSRIYVLLFCGLVGSLIALISASGGVEGFVAWLEKKQVISRKKAQLIAFLIGVLIFIESSITSLIVGTSSRPIFDRLRISREKLAYICDSTSAPVCILIPLNAWGAYIIGLLEAQGVNNPLILMVETIPFNFYAWFALILLAGLILSGVDFGPMKKAELRAVKEGKVLRDGAKPLISSQLLHMEGARKEKPDAKLMVLPVIAMVLSMPFALYLTGGGNILKGSGSASVLIAVSAGVTISVLLSAVTGSLRFKHSIGVFLEGFKSMFPVVALMALAFSFGDVSNALKTGPFVAHLTEQILTPELLPALLFLSSGFIAFSTGTSWGTYAVMIPIASAMISSSGLPAPLILGAVLGGGIFGDHASPVSDTTIISSMAAACDLMDHVQTQLPYASTAAAFSIVFYLIFGFLV